MPRWPTKDNEANAGEETNGETPRYRLTEKAYLNDTLMDVDAEVDFTGIPGYYMKPLNQAAKDMLKKYPPREMNVVEMMTPLVEKKPEISFSNEVK